MTLSIKSAIRRHIQINHGGKNSFSKDNDIIDFSSNVSPLGISKSIKSSLKTPLDLLEDYPDVHSRQLEDSLKKYTKISTKNIVIGNGATEIIYNFCYCFLSKNTPVLIPIPTFAEYEVAAKLAGSKISYLKSMDLQKDICVFIKQIPKNGCVFICNPNNPTGSLISKNTIKKIILESKKKSCIVFVDECFIEMTPNRNESVLSYVKKFENLFVLRSLTKSFGLAGIRIGYGIGNENFVSVLKKIKIPWSVNALAQKAAILSLKDKSHLAKTRNLIKKESKFLIENISKINGFECYPTSTNFILIKTTQKSSSIQKKLLRKKILIRDCKNFSGLNEHFIRIAVKSRNENKKLLGALKKL